MEVKKNTITAAVITRNNQDKIKDCLDSLSWADKIIVIDTGSSDKTIPIVKKYGCEIYSYTKGGYSQWRNYALKKNKSDWIFYVDSDEQVSENLRDEITGIIQNPDKKYGCYVIPRLNNVLGKNLTHGGWYPDYVKRLFTRESLQRWTGNLHEEPHFTGEIYKLKSNLLHTKEQNLHDMIIKTNKWSEIEAELMFSAGHPKMNVLRFISAMTREFWYRFIVKLGFLDGQVGVIFNLYQVYSKFISYAKLWEMQIRVQKLKINN